MQTKPSKKGLAAIYRQELIDDVTLFTSQSSATFYDKLFATLDYALPHARSGRKGYPKEALLSAFIVKMCEGFGYITDLWDYLNNNRLIAHYCGFDITRPLPSYWTFERFLKQTETGVLKDVMASQVKKLYELGILDASFIGLDSTPVMANTAQNNPKSFSKNKYAKDNHPKCAPDCGLGVHSASNQHSERNYEFYRGYKDHILVDCISGLPICDLTTTADVADSTLVEAVLEQAAGILPLEDCTFIGDKGYDAGHVYRTVKNCYNGEAVIPLNPRNTKDPAKLPSGVPICEAGLAMNRDGKTPDGRGGLRQKFCCPFRKSKTGAARSTFPFQTITVLLWTVTASTSSESMRFAQNVRVIISVSRGPGRSVFGSETGTAPQISTPYPTLPRLRLPLLPYVSAGVTLTEVPRLCAEPDKTL